MSSRTYALVVVAWVLAAFMAVTWSLARPGAGVQSDVEALPPPAPGARAPASYETEDTLPSALQGVAVEPVQGGWTGPGGGLFHVVVRSRSETAYRYRQIGRRTFDLGLRLGDAEVAQDPCASCHRGQGAVDRSRVGSGADVHQNIQPVHPRQTGARCLTCHAAEDVGRLRLEVGETVSLDHAYRLCAQCHVRQVESWAHGAHGKRLVGWRGRRVVMTCADCHDPHRPATQQRTPMGGVTLPGALRSEGEEGAERGAGGLHD